jgi:hypothetical protein
MVELHSNFTADGQRKTIDGVAPTYHAEHETIEITQGVNDWSEVGFYIFTSEQCGLGAQWVGDHIRPRVRAPEKWRWPVGVSISNEIGYQRARFSPDTWTWEIRPIVDKQAGPGTSPSTRPSGAPGTAPMSIWVSTSLPRSKSATISQRRSPAASSITPTTAASPTLPASTISSSNSSPPSI